MATKIDTEIKILDNIKKKKTDIKDKVYIEMKVLNKKLEEDIKK